MTTNFKLIPPDASPDRDHKATWTQEDRDFVWLSRLRKLLPVMLVLPAAILGGWMIVHFVGPGAQNDHRAILGFIFVGVVGGPGIAMILAAFDNRMQRRFPERRQRYLYAGRVWSPYISDAVESLEPHTASRGQRYEARRVILAPLRRKVAWFKRALRRIAIVQWTIAALSLAYAASPDVGNAGHVGAAVGIALTMILSGLALSLVWHVMIYDLPPRLNPMTHALDLPPAMAAVLLDAGEDDGTIWLVDDKIVPRALFKTPFAPLLLGTPWDTAHLPFGLWAHTKHIRKEMSGEVREYFRISAFFERVAAQNAIADDDNED